MLRLCDKFGPRSTILTCILIFITHSYVDGGAIPLTEQNIAMTIASNELVFINFYADWCRFSNMLGPIFDEAADQVHSHFNEPGKVVMGKVDCDREATVAQRYHITKYPTLKVLRNGVPTKKEYRGQRKVEAFVDFIKKEMQDPIEEFKNLEDVEKQDYKKRRMIGFFENKNLTEYDVFRRVAAGLKDECQFHAGFGQASEKMHPPGQSVVMFRPDKALSNEEEKTYEGNLLSYDELNAWAQSICVPLVRSITFENAEELTEEGLPFLILFHAPDDVDSIKLYKDIVSKYLIGEKDNINFLTANGEKFEHPLHHLGKSKADLPLIAIDSFRHMYLFPNFQDIRNEETEGKLRGFLKDLYDGKLHREFHNGPDPDRSATSERGAVKTPTTPPESTFKKLAPNKDRYTLLKDEL